MRYNAEGEIEKSIATISRLFGGFFGWMLGDSVELRFGFVQIFVWEAIALLGCIIAGWWLYKNTD